jgi:general secretion pathway protein G
MVNRPKSRGFTLVELMIVISIILILLSFAVPAYQQSIRHAREAVLRDDLHQLRLLIDEYTYDKKKAPQSLDDLGSAGYLKTIPKDPITGQPDWQVDQCTDLFSIDQTETGICDVHSASNLVGTDGNAYSSW